MTTYLESDGKSVTVYLTAEVSKGQVAVAEGWLGITGSSGGSGDYVALATDRREYQFEFPAGLSASKGDIIYVDVTDLTGNTPDTSAYGTSSGGDNEPLCKLTSDLTELPNGNLFGTGILIGGL